MFKPVRTGPPWIFPDSSGYCRVDNSTHLYTCQCNVCEIVRKLIPKLRLFLCLGFRVLFVPDFPVRIIEIPEREREREGGKMQKEDSRGTEMCE